MVLVVATAYRYYEGRKGSMNDAIKQRHAPSAERGRDWRDDAACLPYDPELFFPTGTTGPAAEQILRAKRICKVCPVIMECLNNALSQPNQYGIAGGLTEDERRALRRRRVAPHAYRTFVDHALTRV